LGADMRLLAEIVGDSDVLTYQGAVPDPSDRLVTIVFRSDCDDGSGARSIMSFEVSRLDVLEFILEHNIQQANTYC
jgi:hypothetical protein